MGGTVCKKIMKKVAKLVDLSNNYTPMPAGKGVFGAGKYEVNIEKKVCSCRKWQLTGIPCQHGIACLRHERKSPEAEVHECYSILNFKLAYDEVIMPTKDEREWVGVNGCPILPPVYTKKVGRPPTKRRVAPEDKDGLLSRHGTIQHCSICSSSEHNKRKCPDLGRGDIPVADILGDNLGDPVDENVVVDEPVEEEFRPPKRKLPVRRMPSTEATQTASTHDHLAQYSQTSMLDTLLSNVSAKLPS
jgi:hypothetical protein